jgi:hypothetical protein
LTAVAPYHGAVHRKAVLVALGLVLLLAGCGKPPQPLPKAPPKAFSSPSESDGPVGPGGRPPMAIPSYPLPTGIIPTFPTYLAPSRPPTLPPATTATPVTAPLCAAGPTAAQIVEVARKQPGIPAGVTLVVQTGPYCAGGWQYSTVGSAANDLDPLSVVTKGQPGALQAVEVGQDVCSYTVSKTAPAGIRAWACGS